MYLHDPVVDLQNAYVHFRSLTGQDKCELVIMFPQMWSNTAKGFAEPGKIAGQALSFDYTIILKDTVSGEHAVYFGGRYAYSTPDLFYSQKFFDDLQNQRMATKYDATKRYEKRENETTSSRK